MSVATAQVASHSRFKCGECSAKIEKNSAFIHMKEDSSKVHVKCAKAVLDKTVNADQIKDLDKLDQAAQNAVKALVAPSTKPAAAVAKNASGRPKRAAASGKRKAAEPSDSEESEEDVSAEKPKKKAAAKPKAKAAPKKRSKKASDSEGDGDEEDDDEESEKPATKKTKAPKVKFTLPADVQAKVDAAKEALSDKNQNELKDMLRKNDQAFSGLKIHELIDKIADQQARGKLPRCPKCFGGKLRYDYKGGYKCPGYANDEGKFHRCSFSAKDGEITREPWNN